MFYLKHCILWFGVLHIKKLGSEEFGAFKYFDFQVNGEVKMIKEISNEVVLEHIIRKRTIQNKPRVKEPIGSDIS